MIFIFNFEGIKPNQLLQNSIGRGVVIVNIERIYHIIIYNIIYHRMTEMVYSCVSPQSSMNQSFNKSQAFEMEACRLYYTLSCSGRGCEVHF